MTEQADVVLNPDKFDGKENRIQGLISQLESVKSETVEGIPFNFSSDRKVGELLPRIIKTVKESNTGFQVAIIVSHGALWNIPKELRGIDLVLRINRNRSQLERDRERGKEIIKAKNVNDLLPKSDQSIDKEDIVAISEERYRMEAPIIEKESYGNYHYLFSQATLAKTKAFLRKNNIAFVGGDLSNQEFMKEIGRILKKHNASIVFQDLTNVMNWVGGDRDREVGRGFLKSLGNLPIQDRCPILHSANAGKPGRSPIFSQLSFGLEEYGETSMREDRGFSLLFNQEFRS